MGQATLSEVVGQCLTDNEILAMITLQTTLSYAEVEVATAHLDICEDCKQKLETLSNRVSKIPRRPKKR
jgi:hypothetical protein